MVRGRLNTRGVQTRRINEINGETTSVMPRSITAGNW